MGKIYFIRTLLLSTFILVFNNLAYTQEKDSLKFTPLTPVRFREEVQREGDAMIIDVREYTDYKKSRIKNAINVPASGNLEFASDTLNRDHALFFYCSSGIRSKKVAKYFRQRGFDKIYSLEGGITAWKKSGFPVEKRKKGRR